MPPSSIARSVGDTHIEAGHADAAAKRIRDDPDHDEYLRRWSGIYERANYEAGLAAYFLYGRGRSLLGRKASVSA